MDIPLQSEQALLRDAVRRYVEREYGFEARARRIAEPDGFCRRTWQEMAELGFIAAGLPEDAGGLGSGALGTMIVAEAFGSALVVEPFLATAVLGAAAIELSVSVDRSPLLADLAAGRKLVAFAHAEETERLETVAIAERGGFTLDGRKFAALHATAADLIVVTARLEGAGTALFLVPGDAPGLELAGYRTPDGFPAADVTLRSVQVAAEARLDGPRDGGWLLERVIDRGNAALCAEAVGAMGALLGRTIAYLGNRHQFGAPLARFQALQHRVADMAMELEQARSMMLMAALHVDSTDDMERRRWVSAAKARVARAARFVGEQAVQLHGGVGMTDALDVSHYFRRLTIIGQSFGDETTHLERYLAASGRPGSRSASTLDD